MDYRPRIGLGLIIAVVAAFPIFRFFGLMTRPIGPPAPPPRITEHYTATTHSVEVVAYYQPHETRWSVVGSLLGLGALGLWLTYPRNPKP
jgi:hypothetical protein